MGCVSSSLRHFPDGRIDKKSLKAAVLEARQELAVVSQRYRRSGWREAVGSSGSARSIEGILLENGFAAHGITRDGLDRMWDLLLDAGRADPDRVPGLKSARAAVLPGGFAIMYAIFDELDIEAMTVSEAALRHGVLYDLLGRVMHHDMREATVTQFMRRYHVDAAQAVRVATSRCASTTSSRARPRARTTRTACCSTGPRGSPRSGSRSRTRSTTSTRPTCCRMPTCPVSRASSSSGSRASCSRTAASSRRCRRTASRTATGTWCSRCGSPRRCCAAAPASGSRPSACSPGDARYSLELPKSWLARNALTAAALESEARQWEAVGRQFPVRRMS